MKQEHRFQINLSGIIDLLANHLYSGPEVYLRELLQNGVDALTARQGLGEPFEGKLRIEVVAPPEPNGVPTLLFEDNGIGLTREEVDSFLSTIGLSSKREDLERQRSKFLGQFGIGLLSCFMVSEEIAMVTRSAKPGHKPLEWRGRPDGTYSVEELDRDLAPGTRVFLRARPEMKGLMSPEKVEELAVHYGALLSSPIFLETPKGTRQINATPPWRRSYPSPEACRQAFLDYGRELFETEFFDAFPLSSPSGGVEGIGWVLPFAPSLAARGKHRVYLKGMLVSDAAENLMPDWAFFVRGILDASRLRPTASREGFYEDEAFEQTREELAGTLRAYLCEVARTDPTRLKRLIMLHYLSIKALASEDREFYDLFIDWLPFETSLGNLTLKEAAARSDRIRYVRSRDQFRQVAQIAAAQNLCIVDAGYVYDVQLVEAYPEFRGGIEVEAVEPSTLTERLDDLTLEERDEARFFLEAAESAMRSFRCRVELRKFKPRELPALYSLDRDAAFRRSAENSKATSNALWSSVLDGLGPAQDEYGGYAQLVFNRTNPLVAKLLTLRARPQLERAVQMLYIQALLQGHHPLNAAEMQLLNKGMLDLIEWSVLPGDKENGL